MPRLILLRHATSAWDTGGGGDAARPLSRSGRSEAEAVGRWLEAKAHRPDLILCSPAARTRETLARLGNVLDHAPEIRFIDRLYEDPDGADDYLGLLGVEIDASAVPLVVGHNPMTWNTADLLAGHGDARQRARLRAEFPPGAVAVLDLEGGAVQPRAGHLVDFVTPRDLADA